MAFIASGLQAFNNGGSLGSGSGSVATLWHYITNDPDTDIEANGYFDATAMKSGDTLQASLDMDGTPEIKMYVVSVGTGDPASNDVTIVPMSVV